MSVLRCKGTLLELDVAGTYTPVVQIVSLSFSGASNRTFESTTLDQASAYATHAWTGYNEPGEVQYECFYDPSLTIHKKVNDVYKTGGTGNWRVKFTDSGNTVQSFTSCGLTLGNDAKMADGLRQTVRIAITGDPGYPS